MNQYTMCIDVGGKGKENKKDGGLLNGLRWRDRYWFVHTTLIIFFFTVIRCINGVVHQIKTLEITCN